jgi:hypothetical protein
MPIAIYCNLSSSSVTSETTVMNRPFCVFCQLGAAQPPAEQCEVQEKGSAPAIFMTQDPSAKPLSTLFNQIFSSLTE